jgi:hypothetical protein
MIAGGLDNKDILATNGLRHGNRALTVCKLSDISAA